MKRQYIAVLSALLVVIIVVAVVFFGQNRKKTEPTLQETKNFYTTDESELTLTGEIHQTTSRTTEAFTTLKPTTKLELTTTIRNKTTEAAKEATEKPKTATQNKTTKKITTGSTKPTTTALSAESKYNQARAVAEEIAAGITGSNDLERVYQAAQIVADYSSRATYTMEGKDYATAYGVFIKGEYSCAGSTRALGMLLECMGYSWKHVNENQYTHQWVEVTMDGQKGWADGQIGMAGYGEFPFAN